MDTTKQPTNDIPAEVPANEENTPKTWGRRELLKALAATSGAVALSNIPNKWDKPEVGFGVLPAHAQGSNNNVGPGPGPIYAITTCNAQNSGGGTDISPSDTVSTFVIITPTDAGIQMRRRILRNSTEVNNITGATDATGTYTSPNFVPNSFGFVTGDRMDVEYTFVNPTQGTDICTRTSIMQP